MITCKSGITIRMGVSSVSAQGRATQGVKLIRLDDGDEIAAITKLEIHVEHDAIEPHIPGEILVPDEAENGDLPDDIGLNNEEKATGETDLPSGEDN